MLAHTLVDVASAAIISWALQVSIEQVYIYIYVPSYASGTRLEAFCTLVQQNFLVNPGRSWTVSHNKGFGTLAQQDS